MNFAVAITQALQYHLRSNWYILLFGIALAVGINVYLDPEKLRAFLNRRAGVSIPGAVAFGALTPLCACGTMAVLVSMFATVMPWGAVMAFLVASPLTSPSDYMFQSAFLGSRFAVAMLVSAVSLGMLGGTLAYVLEKKTAFFKGQFRLASVSQQPAGDAGCCAAASAEPLPQEPNLAGPAADQGCCTKASPLDGLADRLRLRELGTALWDLGVRRILLYFVLFISIGTVVEMLIPSALIYSVFGSGQAHSIPLSATLGLPLYVSSSSALPLLRSFINAGAGEGAVLAFLIAGKGTSLPVMLGMSTFLKPRSIALYASLVFAGSVFLGYAYDFILMMAV